jgi:hypothetical protein
VPALDAPTAALLARAFIRDTWALVCSLSWARPVLAVTAESEVLRSLTGADEVWLQGAGDLGDRMERVLRRALTGAARALVIGTDSPHLPPRLLGDAHAALLAGAPAVLGPAADGGFYLLGLAQCPDGLLGGLEWSHGAVLEQTSRRLASHELPPGLLEPCFDVDYPADLLRLARELRAGRLAAPETAHLLRQPELERALRRIAAAQAG